VSCLEVVNGLSPLPATRLRQAFVPRVSTVARRRVAIAGERAEQEGFRRLAPAERGADPQSASQRLTGLRRPSTSTQGRRYATCSARSRAERDLVLGGPFVHGLTMTRVTVPSRHPAGPLPPSPGVVVRSPHYRTKIVKQHGGVRRPQNRRHSVPRIAAPVIPNRFPGDQFYGFSVAQRPHDYNCKTIACDGAPERSRTLNLLIHRRAVPLAPSAVRLLASLSRDKENPWVIPGRRCGMHLNDLRHPWQRIRPRAGLPGVRIHDLRHSFASRALALGEGLPMIGKLLGHTQVQTTARYAHLARDTKKVLAARIGDSIDRDLEADGEVAGQSAA